MPAKLLKYSLFIGFLLAASFAFPQKKKPMWRPNKVPAGLTFVGSQACAECHASKVKSQAQTLMGLALEPVATSRILTKFPKLTFRSGPYSYEITRQGDQSLYTVSDGKDKISIPILYAFGQGYAGQTYVLKYRDAYYESRVSFYAELNGLDFTIGSMRAMPTTLEDAVGRPTPHDESVQCFSCHSTGAAAGGKIELGKLMPGVTCETCHGPGSEHIAMSKAGAPNNTEKIFNPGKLAPDDLTQEFCASCHRGVEDLFAMPKQGGLNNVRFQPYRIFNSKCYSDDRRISCVACHNVHEPMKTDPAFYDAKCAACHSKQEPQAKLCKVSTNNCVSCHMPKTDLEGSHHKFNDHRIRIVKPGEPYPY